MAPRQKKADELKAKEAKQKKLLAVLAVLLVALMAIQGPKLLKHGPPSAPPPETTAAAPPPPTTGSTATLAPPSLSGSPGGTATPATGGSSQLVDTDTAPAADAGQLVGFDLFSSKDPFLPQVDATASAGTTPAAGDTPPDKTSTTPSGSLTTPPPATTTTPSEPTTVVASLSVNGKAEPVQSAHDFPSIDPVFRLEFVAATTATISIVGGSYADGSATLKLVKGKSVTLQNAGDGTRYTIVFLGRKKVPTSSLPPEPATTTPSATTPTATTPTATTPTSTTP